MMTTMMVVALFKGISNYSFSASLTLFPLESSGRIYFHFLPPLILSPFLPTFFWRHADFLYVGGPVTVCRERWEAIAWEMMRELMSWTGLGLNITVGGKLGTISAIQIVDIPAGQLKTDVSD